MIVDDSPAVLRAASELLECQGILVVGVAATGVQAVRLIDELEPDVVLVDIDLGPSPASTLPAASWRPQTGRGRAAS